MKNNILLSLTKRKYDRLNASSRNNNHRYQMKGMNNMTIVCIPFLFALLIGITVRTSSVQQQQQQQYLGFLMVNAKQQQSSSSSSTIFQKRTSLVAPSSSITNNNKKQQQQSTLINNNKNKNKVVVVTNQHHAHHEEELMSGPVAVANVLADLCPHGMLPIAFGMAAGGGTGIGLATIILLIFGTLSWYSLISFARAAEVTLVVPQQQQDKQQHSTTITTSSSGESLSAVWERSVPNGNTTKYIPDLGCVCLTVGCLLFYSAFIGDLFGSLVSGLTFLPSILRQRWSIILLLHTIPILPLCLIKDLSALQYSSMTGLIGIVYTIYFVGKRLLDGTYTIGGQYYTLMPTKFQPSPQIDFPHVNTKSILGYVVDIPLFHSGKGLLTLMNMCCVAYACHYNAVKYYMELKDRTISASKKVMGFGIGGTAFVFWCMMILGYGTFGKHSQTLLLNNYHPSLDTMATLARIFTGIAIISGYALMFAGYKAALFSLLQLDQPNVVNRTTKQTILSAISLAIIAIAACFVTEHELGTVIGIVGSVFGSIVIYMFPAIINNSLLQKKDRFGKQIAQPFFYGETIFNNVMIVFGIIFAILGTWISISPQDVHH